MPETLDVRPEQLVPTIIMHWDRLSAATLETLASEVWTRWSVREGLSEAQGNALTADASILASLRRCKSIESHTTLAALRNLWREVNDGDDACDFSGLMHGEESPHYLTAVTFIERLFLPHVERCIQNAFDEVAGRAAGAATAEARAQLFEDAADVLSDQFGDFEFETVKIEQLVANKSDLLRQLADAEREPGRIAAARNYIRGVQQHLARRQSNALGRTKLQEADVERIARQLARDRRVMSSIEGYPADRLVTFGRGRASAQTVAFRAVT
jgi:hypothetical protein